MFRLTARSASRLRFAAPMVVSLLVVLSMPVIAFANVTLTQISADPYTNTTSQHKTEVEPDSFSFGSSIVSTIQVGRFNNGGSSDIGWGMSSDGGNTWTNGFLPGLTVFSTPPGTWDRVSDPSVAYDASHNVWLINSLGLRGASSVTGAAVVVNRSTDGGQTWGNSITVRAASGRQDWDKNWITCDDTATSPFYGRCYIEYDDAGAGNVLHMEFSTDGGLTWSASSVPSASVIGGQPVVQPNGTVVMPIDNGNETSLMSTVSTNGGVSYSSLTTITTITVHNVGGALRSGPLPSAEVDGAGTVYVVWQDCRFRTRCRSNDIVMTTSTNGTTWTPVARVPIGVTTDPQDHFIPGIAVDRDTAGSSAHVAVTYYYYPNAKCSASTCQLDVGYVSSGNGGASWTAFTQVAGPMTLSWLANTTQGRMVGDYMSSSFSNGLAHGIFAVANAPTAGGTNCATATPNCDEAMYTNAAGLARSGQGLFTSAGDQPVAGAASDQPASATPLTAR